jgi:hypothetical protein
MKVSGREIGVWRVVLVQPPDRRIGEQHGAAAVGLKAMLVWVDHDRRALRTRLLLRRKLVGLLWLNLHRIGFPTWLRAARLPDAGATAAFIPAASSASASFAA